MVKRSEVIRAAIAVLVGDAGLRTTLGHVQGSSTIAGGARVFGFDVRLEAIPERCVIVSFADGSPVRPGEINTWNLNLDLYAPDVFHAADVLDDLERIGANYTSASQPGPVRLNRFSIGNHQSLEVGDARLIITRVALEVRWAQ